MLRTFRNRFAASFHCRGNRCAAWAPVCVYEVRSSAHRTLQRLLRINRNSAWAQSLRLQHVQTVEEFRRICPLTCLTNHREGFETLPDGPATLLPGTAERIVGSVEILNMGEQSGRRVALPVTVRSLREVRRAWKMWCRQAWCLHPRLRFLETIRLSAGPRMMVRHVNPARSYGSEALELDGPPDLWSRFTLQEAEPSSSVENYCRLRLGLARRRVGLIVVESAQSLLELSKFADAHAEELLKDIYDGTLTPPGEPSGSTLLLRLRGMRRLRPDPRRSQELDRVLYRLGRLGLSEVWTSLQLLGVERVQRSLGNQPDAQECWNIPQRSLGFWSVIGRLTLPTDDFSPAGLPDIERFYVEFLPEEGTAFSSEWPREVHELREGGRYRILVTASCGLWRCDVGEVIECVGWEQGLPWLQAVESVCPNRPSQGRLQTT